MPKRATGLSAAKVAREKEPGRYSDGGGLQLLVKPSGAAVWVLRYSAGGIRRDMGLGTARGSGAVTLAEARERTAELRRLVNAGIDPLQQRQAEAAATAAKAQAAIARAKTFKEVADLYLAAQEAGWRNAKHRAQWAMTLRDYAGPHLGALPVAEIETAHVAAALCPLWRTKPETATRLRGRIEAVLDYASVHGWREGANPERWRGHLDKVFPRRAKVRPVEHHAALPWQDLPGFMVALRTRVSVSGRALEFAILTGPRSGEVLGSKWPEVDLDGAVWTVPAQRMKAHREHRVALSPAAVALLQGLLPLRTGPGALVFPGQIAGSPLSVMAMTMVLRRMARGDLTVHGFRSTFRDWAGETTPHPREVVEAALAHRLGDKVEQAYARGDLFTKRRKLMEDWAAYCAKPCAEVVALHPAAESAEAGA
jgi:integrase